MSARTFVQPLSVVDALSAKRSAITLQAVAWSARAIVAEGGVDSLRDADPSNAVSTASPLARALVVVRARFEANAPTFRPDEVKAPADVPTLRSLAANACWLHGRIGGDREELVEILRAAGPSVALSQVDFRFAPEDGDIVLRNP